MNTRTRTRLFGACLLLLASRGIGQTISWNNPAGGLWSEASNWDLNRIPTASDTVLIVLRGTYTVTLGGSGVARCLTVGADSGRQTLSVTPTWYNGVNLTVGGKLTGRDSSRIILDVWNGGTLVVDSTFTNAGTLTVTNSSGTGYQGPVRVNSGWLVNEGTIDIVQGAGGGRTLDASLDNRGVVNVNWPLSVTKNSSAHINSGTINVHEPMTVVQQSGANPSFTNRGTVVVDSGKTLLFQYGAFLQDQGTVTGKGVFRAEGVKMSLVSDFTVSVPSTQLAGTVVRGPGTLIVPEAYALTLVGDSIICPLDLAGHMGNSPSAFTGTTTYILGRLTTHSSSRITADAGNQCMLVVDSTFTNAGTITVTTSSGGYTGYIVVRNGWLINTGTINFPVAGSASGRWLEASLDNRGVVNVDCPVTIMKAAATHVNTGTINARANFTVSQSAAGASFTNRGTVAVDSGRTFLIEQGQFVQDQGTVTGRGAFRAENMKMSLVSDFTVGVPSLQLISTAVRGPGTLTIPETCRLALVGDSIICPLDLAGHMGNSPSAFTGTTTYILGRLTTHGSSTIAADVVNQCRLIVDSTFTNEGTITVYSSYDWYLGEIAVRNGWLINTGTINFPAGGSTSVRGLHASLDNRGVVTLDVPVSIVKSSPTHINSGTINVRGGTLTVLSDGANPTFTNSGTISLTYGKALVITAGKLTTTSTSLLNVEIGGRVPNVDLAQVRVSGGAVVAGTLNILLANNFLPEIDDSLTLFAFWSRSGAFQSIRIPLLNGNPMLVSGYGTGDVHVKAFIDFANIRELTIGQPLPDSLGAGFYRFYKVLLPGGVSPLFRAGCLAPLQAPQLFVTRDTLPSRSQFDFRSTNDLPQSSEIAVVQADSGMHFMLVHNPELTAVTYTVQVDTLGYMIRRVRYPASGNNGEVTVEILGAKLQQGARAHLSRLGQATIPDTAGFLVDPTQLNTRFPLANLAEGDWDLTIINPDTTTALLPRALTLSQNTAAQLNLSLAGPDRIHRDYVGRFTLSATNPSNTNVERALVFIETRPDIEITARVDSVALDSLIEDRNLVTWIDSTGARFFCLGYRNIGPGRTKTIELEIIPRSYGEYRFYGYIATFSRRHFDTLLVNARNEAIAQGWVDTSSFTPPGGQTLYPGSSGSGILNRPNDEGESYVNQYNDYRNNLLDVSKEGQGLVTDGMKSLYFPCKKPSPGILVYVTGLMAKMKNAHDRFFRPRHPLPGPESVQSFDPNDIVIPVGSGALNWVQAKSLSYRVEFENLADSATAPARYVRTRYRLDPSLDPGSLSLGSFGFRNMQFPIPPSLSQYQARLDLRDSLGAYVDVNAALNGDSLIWTFETIDPQTGWPTTDPMGGFLPINDSTGKGTGYVTFSASPKANVATGTRINAQALIVFDSNTPIATPVKFNTLDGSAPASRVGRLDDSSATWFDVRWSGSDEGGIASYTVYFTDNGMDYRPWVSDVSDTAGRFSGSLGSTYGFYSVAVDTAGNVERTKLFSEASTRVYTGVVADNQLPASYYLFQNYPNPFNPTSTIRVALPEAAHVTLTVYNILGQRVRTLMDERLTAGYHNIRFDATGLASGIYFCRVRAGAYVSTRKMLLMR